MLGTTVVMGDRCSAFTPYLCVRASVSKSEVLYGVMSYKLVLDPLN